MLTGIRGVLLRVQGSELFAVGCEICSVRDQQILRCPCKVCTASHGHKVVITTLTCMLVCLAVQQTPSWILQVR